MDEITKFEMAKRISTFGHFAFHLMEAWFHADQANRQRIEDGFGHLFNKARAQLESERATQQRWAA